MAETAQPQQKEPSAASKVVPKAALRPDYATLGGLALALTGILGGLLLEKGSIQDVVQGTAFMIVMGGTLGAVLVTTPLAIVWRAFKGLGSIFFESAGSASATTETLI
jgi:chemotaxis protein MotA